MKMNVTVTIGATALLMASTIGLAGSAVADDSATSTTVAEMPALKDEVLSSAVSAVNEAIAGTRSAAVPIAFSNLEGPAQKVLNQSAWYVCYQSPGAGKTVPKSATQILLYVRRANQGC